MFRDISNFGLNVVVSMLGLLIVVNQADGQQFDQSLDELASTNRTEKLVHGVVTQQNKYSIVVQSGDEEYAIKLPRTIPIARELVRPKFDLANSKLQITLPCTGLGGDQSKNQVVEFSLPGKVYLVASFNTEKSFNDFISERADLINRYSLVETKPDNLEPLQICGVLEQNENGLYLATDTQRYAIKLGGRVSLLTGFSILDLKPRTEVSVKAMQVDNEWVAQAIQFQIIPQQETADPDLPRVLSLGDMVSFSYQRALHERLEGKYSVYHPPTNCGGSDNWPVINRWLGDYSKHSWDVIIFNTGMMDTQTDKETYQANLRRWVELLRPAGKRLIWLTTTPIQGSIPGSVEEDLFGKVPGRMKLQNRWATEVLSDFPEVEFCDLWQVVMDSKETDLEDWWKSTRPQFTYKQSKIVAEAIANTIGE